MNATFDVVEGLTLVNPVGRLDFEASAIFQKQMEQVIAEAAGRSSQPVLVNCAALDYVSSAGLRVFLVAARAAKSAGIRFSVCALTASVKEVFDVSGFSRIIDVQADLDSAKGVLAASRSA